MGLFKDSLCLHIANFVHDKNEVDGIELANAELRECSASPLPSLGDGLCAKPRGSSLSHYTLDKYLTRCLQIEGFATS